MNLKKDRKETKKYTKYIETKKVEYKKILWTNFFPRSRATMRISSHILTPFFLNKFSVGKRRLS